MERLFSKCKSCNKISDVPYMLVCPHCGGDMYTFGDNINPQGNGKKIGFFSAYAAMFKKTFDFRTRSRRSEYWYANLMNFIICLIFIVALGLIQYYANMNLTPTGDFASEYVSAYRIVEFLFTVYSFVVLIPQLSLTVRRLHDIGRGPLLAILSFSPILSFVLIYYMVQDSMPGYNRYGANPKE